MIFKKILAYTLAEVLITMGIVGAIAAMTIPTLVNKRVQAERSAKLKKFYSKMNNAVDQMVIDNNSFKYYNGAPSNSYKWYMENLDRYMGHAMLDGTNKKVYFVDESSLKFEEINHSGCKRISYDTNGDKSPNNLGSDIYVFIFCFTEDSRKKYLGDNSSSDTFFGAYNFYSDKFDQKTAEEKNAKCNSSREYCTRLLQSNGWDYPPGYPFK